MWRTHTRGSLQGILFSGTFFYKHKSLFLISTDLNKQTNNSYEEKKYQRFLKLNLQVQLCSGIMRKPKKNIYCV